MFQGQFTDRNNPPNQDLIHETIGQEVSPVWIDTIGYLAKAFPGYESELMYYNPQRGWGIRYRKESQQLVMLFPEKHRFTAMLTLNPDEVELAQAKIHFFNTRIRELLNQIASTSEWGMVWLRLEDHTDFVGLKLLLEIKAGR
jgi:hypothetical protein